MSVRVIEAPKPPEPMRSRCKCGALLEFERADLTHHQSRPGEDVASVRCPHCKGEHFFDLARSAADPRHPFVSTGAAS